MWTTASDNFLNKKTWFQIRGWKPLKNRNQRKARGGNKLNRRW